MRRFARDPDRAALSREAHTAARDMVRRIEAVRGEARRVVLVGYSQGAILALCVAAVAPDLADGILVAAGLLPEEVPIQRATSGTVTLVHGAGDSIVSPSRALGSARRLQRAGWSTRYISLRAEHALRGELRRRLRVELRALLRSCL